MKNDKKITILDLARIAGVSKSTVSRVLSGDSKVSPAAKRAVAKAVEQTNYRINRTARDLRRGKTDFIAVIVPDISNGFFAEIIAAVQLSAKKSGLYVVIFDTQESAEEELEALAVAEQLNISGLILITTMFRGDKYELQKPVRIPTVLVDREHDKQYLFLRHTGVYTDNYGGGVIAAQKIADILPEREKILIIRDRRDISNIAMRHSGFCDFLRDTSHPIFTQSVAQPIKNREPEFAPIIQLCKEEQIRCVFCLNDMISHVTLSAFKKAQYAIPKDICVLGFDGSTWRDKVDPSLATIAQNPSGIGNAAFQSLLELFEESNTSIPAKEIQPYYLAGGTLQ